MSLLNHGRNVLMVLTDGDLIRAAETDEELFIFDVSDDALERTANVGIGLSVVTLNFGTGIVGNCGCPCIKAREAGEAFV
jgi:hypothetical protein